MMEQRTTKEGVTLPGGMEYGQFRREIESLATDSLPALDLQTVRVESVEPIDGAYRVTISGVERTT